MKIIRSDSGFLLYKRIFKHLQANQSVIVVWQVLAHGREIGETRLSSFHAGSQLLHLELQPAFQLDPSEPLYCYAEDGQLIFKTGITEIREKNFTAYMPEELKLLEDDEVTVIKGQSGVDLSDVWKVKRLRLEDGPDDLTETTRVKSMAERSSRDQDFLNQEFNLLSVDEEDKIFADKRESPRARPKKDRWVKVIVLGKSEIQLERLFDLSQGGMGFLTTFPDHFPKGSEIHIVGFDEFDLDDPLIGQIMSQRPLDDTQVEFKIGVKFNEGQE